jgi:hypothetical protein
MKQQRIGILLSLCLALFCTPIVCKGALTLSDFRDCISWDPAKYGPYQALYGDLCQLGPNPDPGSNGVWDVTSQLEIGRDNVRITGTPSDSADVILRRTAAVGAADMMYALGGITVQEISWLTFDGNRNSSQCSDTELAIADLNLDLTGFGLATVHHVTFIRSRWNALFLRGTFSDPSQGIASTVSYSNFGLRNGFVKPTRGYNLTGPQTAIHWDAVRISDDGTGVWYNHIAYTGHDAINALSGSLQYVIGNDLFSNRYEQPDGVSGGQLFIEGPTYVSVANNMIDGNNWTTTGHNTSNTDIYCTPASGLYTLGIEAIGTGNRYYNNQIQNNTAWGMLLHGSPGALDYTVVSGYDPFCEAGYPAGCVFVPHYITNNASCWSQYGCYGPPYPSDMEVSGLTINMREYPGSPGANITLDHVRVTNNGRHGVSLNNLVGTPGFTDSKNSGNPYACIQNNAGQNLRAVNVGPAYTSYINLCP